jgi:response regulator RpfG family c-di-GMP phosphodiesterase
MADRARILIVEDERGPRESLRMILAPPHDVCTASDGAAALEFLERNAVDLITLDLKMPGMQGMEVLERIRQSNPDVMVIIVTGCGTFRSIVEAINLDVFDHISKPFNIQEVRSAVQRSLETGATIRAIKKVFSQLSPISGEKPSKFLQPRIPEDLKEIGCSPTDFEFIKNAKDSVEFLRIVSRCIEKRDPHRIGHSERVNQYTDLMAQKLGLSHSVREEIKLASYLHDIGEVCISSRIKNKGEELSSTDWAILRRHSIKSAELIKPLGLSGTVISAIRHHHERFDGTGYPDGLTGTDIPLGARIISLGNVYDSLRSNQPYRNAMGYDEATAEIHKHAGTYFDPDLVQIFLEALKEQEERFSEGINLRHEGHPKA